MKRRNNKKNLKSQKEVEKRYADIVLDTVLPAEEEGFQGPEEAFKDVQSSYALDGVNMDYYFASYSHFQIHEDMLKDEVRTLAYRDAIVKNWHLFQGKTVLDIGCGTGILSIFAAKAGAKHVYAIDNASIAIHASQIVKDNQLGDKITVIKGKVEEVTLPVDKVDIIISEWMGYFLLYESMLDTVLYARDKWMGKDGILFPDRCVLKVALAEDGAYREEKTKFWDNVYDADMSCIKTWVMQEPCVDVLNKNQVVSTASTILDIDLQTVTKEDLDFASTFQVEMTQNSDAHAIVSWFDCFFSHSHNDIVLSTSPFYKRTHWKQTVFYLNKSIRGKKGDSYNGRIAVKKSKENPRALNIKIGTSGVSGEQTQYFQLA